MTAEQRPQVSMESVNAPERPKTLQERAEDAFNVLYNIHGEKGEFISTITFPDSHKQIKIIRDTDREKNPRKVIIHDKDTNNGVVTTYEVNIHGMESIQRYHSHAPHLRNSLNFDLLLGTQREKEEIAVRQSEILAKKLTDMADPRDQIVDPPAK